MASGSPSGFAVVACMVSIILKEFKFATPSAALILGTIGLMCVYISVIMFKGAAEELREKKAREQASGNAA